MGGGGAGGALSNLMVLLNMTIMEDEFGIIVKSMSMHVAANEEEALNRLFEMS